MERGFGNGSGMDSAVIRGSRAQRLEKMAEPDWTTADKVRKARKLRGYLCSNGARDYHECIECESPCAFGRRAVELIEGGEIKGWEWTEPTKTLIAKRKWEKEHKRIKRLEKWITQKHEAMEATQAWAAQIEELLGERYEDWFEWLMETEARVQRATRGAPEWPEDAEDVDVAVVSGLVRLHGFHVFDVMVG